MKCKGKFDLYFEGFEERFRKLGHKLTSLATENIIRQSMIAMDVLQNNFTISKQKAMERLT